jgi:hypothetical protein
MRSSSQSVFKKSLHPLRRVSSPQSQIYVIDTAIVRSTCDTTRHLYSFNAKAKRASDLRQRLADNLWVDIWRTTNTYGTNGNMLSTLCEEWSNGQWVRSTCYTFTYDVNGNGLSGLSEEWSNGQRVNTLRFTYTCDAHGNLMSAWHYSWLKFSWTHRDVGGEYDRMGLL